MMKVAKGNLDIENSLIEEIKQVSETLGISQNEFIERAINFYLDYIDGLIADKISKEVKKGNIKVKDADEVFKELGINV